MPRTLALTLEYDGTKFFGWQVQPDTRTVQGELEKALARILQQTVRIIGAGRTDTGVHALGQVASFSAETKIPVDEIKRALNSLTPDDIVVHDTRDVPEGFSARWDAREREYEYRITHELRAVGRGYAWYLRKALDVDAMREGCLPLLGVHDFTSFCVAAAERETRDCDLRLCEWTEEDHDLVLRLKANRFLRAMVRSIVGTLVDVGRGFRSPDTVARTLAAHDRSAAGPSAPPEGLFLVRVSYEAQNGKHVGDVL